ncbi:hypothetical protein HK100_006755, partial [Physocladia obscura]
MTTNSQSTIIVDNITSSSSSDNTNITLDQYTNYSCSEAPAVLVVPKDIQSNHLTPIPNYSMPIPPLQSPPLDLLNLHYSALFQDIPQSRSSFAFAAIVSSSASMISGSCTSESIDPFLSLLKSPYISPFTSNIETKYSQTIPNSLKSDSVPPRSVHTDLWSRTNEIYSRRCAASCSNESGILKDIMMHLKMTEAQNVLLVLLECMRFQRVNPRAMHILPELSLFPPEKMDENDFDSQRNNVSNDDDPRIRYSRYSIRDKSKNFHQTRTKKNTVANNDEKDVDGAYNSSKKYSIIAHSAKVVEPKVRWAEYLAAAEQIFDRLLIWDSLFFYPMDEVAFVNETGASCLFVEYMNSLAKMFFKDLPKTIESMFAKSGIQMQKQDQAMTNLKRKKADATVRRMARASKSLYSSSDASVARPAPTTTAGVEPTVISLMSLTRSKKQSREVILPVKKTSYLTLNGEEGALVSEDSIYSPLSAATPDCKNFSNNSQTTSQETATPPPLLLKQTFSSLSAGSTSTAFSTTSLLGSSTFYNNNSNASAAATAIANTSVTAAAASATTTLLLYQPVKRTRSSMLLPAKHILSRVTTSAPKQKISHAEKAQQYLKKKEKEQQKVQQQQEEQMTKASSFVADNLDAGSNNSCVKSSSSISSCMTMVEKKSRKKQVGTDFASSNAVTSITAVASTPAIAAAEKLGGVVPG